MVIDGAMDGRACLPYVEQCLGPILRPGDTVMIDNCPVHKVVGVREAIEARGATLQYVPEYSPDLKPTELSFSKIKAYLLRANRSRLPARGCFYTKLWGTECRNYLKHAGKCQSDRNL